MKLATRPETWIAKAHNVVVVLKNPITHWQGFNAEFGKITFPRAQIAVRNPHKFGDFGEFCRNHETL